mgnify:FL=1|jgi:hypothetical protein|tara:strand:- start:115 stop:2097 length:1983 start_codon:yes stop_codon:yes gene_type:complete
MARTSTKKNLVKQVNYLNKDFSDFRDNLIEFAKVYFPNTYNDFNEASPGMMFIEMAAYVGDVLSYYIDSQFRESLLAYAEEKRNVYNIAQSFGYKPKTSSPASVVLDVFQTIPALNEKPDERYAVTVKAGTQVISTSTGTTFRTLDDVNFKFSSSYDQRDVTIFESDDNIPTKFLLRKKITAESGNIVTETFSFGSAEKYAQIKLSNPKVIEIVSCTDSDGNTWSEVDSLARDTIFEDIENNATNDPTSVINRETSPYILKLKKTSRRFTRYIDQNDSSVLRFGAGISDNADEEIIPNPSMVGSTLPGSPTFLTTAFDPSNFLKTKSFGLAPSNTTLTIKYAYGGGIDSNVNSNDITSISSISYEIQDALLSTATVQESKDSVSFINPKPATGGSAGESIREVREHALAYFQAQQRAVTKEDYIIRAYSLPAKYGNIAKVHLVQDDQLNKSTGTDELDRIVTQADVDNKRTIKSLQVRTPNPLAMNMYTLGYDSNKKLSSLNQTVKENLKTYLSQYRLVTDAVNIKDAYVINIAVNFAILTKSEFAKNDVLLRCVAAIKDFFDIDRWQIGQPIVLSDIAYELSLVDGVASVVPPVNSDTVIQIENKYKAGQGYSGNFYDIKNSLIDGVLYPALDPSIFEIKYPNADIKGKVVGDNMGIVE